MRDRGLVRRAEKDVAQVEVECFSGCAECSAKSLCTGQEGSTGLLTVKNALQASEGDWVLLQIPESVYSRSLIQIFSTLLAAVLAGLGGGFLLSLFLPVPSSIASLFGILLCLFFAGIFLYKTFRRKIHLYPEIIDILKKGETHG